MGTFDDAVSLSDVRAPWLGQALGRHAAARRRALRAQGHTSLEVELSPLWSLSAADLRAQFDKAVDDLGLRWVVKCRYGLRHGGASRDVLSQLRPLQEVQRRGRWAVLSSIKHQKNTDDCSG